MSRILVSIQPDLGASQFDHVKTFNPDLGE